MQKVVMHETNEDDEIDIDDEVVTPTDEAYPELTIAYDWFNKTLFNGDLPPCLITLAIRGKSLGYFWPNRFQNTDGAITAELALNPEIMKLRSDRETLSTLVHEMCHAWQQAFGKPSRSGYHNKQFAMKMEAVGLMPSSTGKPGGKKTGQRMTHYIIEGGPFDVECAELIEGGFVITWKSAPIAKKKAKKPKYRCPSCGAQVWGRPGLNVLCGDCSVLCDECEEHGAVMQPC